MLQDNDREALIARAAELMRKRFSASVLETFGKLDETGKEDPRARRLGAEALLRLGRFSEGLRAAQDALSRTEDARLAFDIGEMLRAFDAFGDGGICYAKAVKLLPGWVLARRRFEASLHAVLGDFGQIASLAEWAGITKEEALGLADKHDRALWRLARLRRAHHTLELASAPAILEEAVKRAIEAFNSYCALRNIGLGRGGRVLLCVVRNRRRIRRIYYRHPRDQGPGPFRRWNEAYYEEAPILKGGFLGEWKEVRPKGEGDPQSQGSGRYMVEKIARGLYRRAPRTPLNPDELREAWRNVQEYFQGEFGLPLPAEWHPDPTREPLSPDSDWHLVFSKAVTKPFPIMSDNLEKQPVGAWLVGSWGYGANSYAFYLVRKDERREIFLRLGYGGFYGDRKRDGEAVARFVKRVAAFENWAKENLDRWGIYNNMGSCGGWVERGGEREELSTVGEREFHFPNEGTSLPNAA